MTLRDLVYRNRSIRRFDESQNIERSTLVELVELARHTASAANLQPLKYILSCDVETNTLIFPCLRWAGYLKDWDGPGPGERPSAYIVILGDTRIARAFDCDMGIAAQTMLLGAVERGLGGCIIATLSRETLRAGLGIPDHCELIAVIALGRPAEQVEIEPVGPSGEIKYWRDAAGVHHVPKRALSDIIFVSGTGTQ